MLVAQRVVTKIFWATGQLSTVFCTRFSFFRKVADFKNNDSFAECFDANLKRRDSCARCFGQVLPQRRPTSSKSTVAQSLSTPILGNRIVAHGLLDKFLLVIKRRQAQANRQFRRVFWRQFRARRQLRTVFWTSCYQNPPSSSRTKVVQSVLTPISINWTVAHGVVFKL